MKVVKNSLIIMLFDYYMKSTVSLIFSDIMLKFIFYFSIALMLKEETILELKMLKGI